jgi:hypothetical protein
MTEKQPIDETKRYEFYRDQFERHSNRVMEYQKDRLRVALLAITGVAAMFAWLSTSADTDGPAQIMKGMYFVPSILAVFGWAFHLAVGISMKRHVGFMDMIETEILQISPYNCASAWEYYKKQKDDTKCFGKVISHLGCLYWFVLLFISIVLGFLLCTTK